LHTTNAVRGDLMSAHNWTREQEGALQAVDQWFKGPNRLKPFYLAGYAGTGKTTLAKYFAQNVRGTVLFAAFTGKAASVLRLKGCPGATTVHSLIYNPVGNANTKRIKEIEKAIAEERTKGQEINIPKLEKLRTEMRKLEAVSREQFELKDRYDSPHMKQADLIILDECSMIDMIMAKDLVSFKVPILVLGDPAQLPPVKGKGAWIDAKPDYLLKEIHRQAQDSNIIRLAHDIRNGVMLSLMEHADCMVREKKDMDWQELVTADQVITGKNHTRHALNKAIRKLNKHTKLFPIVGDKLICLKNDHEEGLLNGVTCEAYKDSEKIGNTVLVRVNYEGAEHEFFCDPGHFEETYYNKRLSFPNHGVVKHFAYGYAITGHKSQGSQWEKVVVCDDKMRSQDLEMRKKWLYTVITRAEKQLIMYK